MSSPSNTYRLVRYDAANMVLTAELIKAASDDEAIATAQATAGKCELWHGNRLVAETETRKQA
jgi:hypothetical protein